MHPDERYIGHHQTNIIQNLDALHNRPLRGNKWIIERSAQGFFSSVWQYGKTLCRPAQVTIIVRKHTKFTGNSRKLTKSCSKLCAGFRISHSVKNLVQTNRGSTVCTGMLSAINHKTRRKHLGVISHNNYSHEISTIIYSITSH